MSDKDDAALSAHNLGFGNFTFLLIFLFWTLVMASLAAWHYNHERQAALENARTAARQSFSKDLVARRWASGHGGVYVPVSATTPPSTYLAHLPERDITTPSGRALTLLNPAYISRQLHEIAKTTTEDGYGHITSLAPLRPGNAPDVWEQKALKALTAGAPEWSSLEQLEGVTFLRLMRPMVMEPACLHCHPDNQVGELRGGISVAIPWTPYQTALRQTWAKHILGHGSIWLLGLMGLLFSRHQLHRNLAYRCQVEQHLRRSEEKYRLLTEGTTAIPWEFDIQADRWDYVAPQVTRMLGYEPEEWTDLRFWVDHIHPEDRHRAADYCQTSTALGEDHQFEYRFLKKDGGIAWLRDVVCVEMEGKRPVRMRGVMIDLTEHRSLEEKLRQAVKMEAVGTLAAGVAHDFNNILTSLISFATLVKRRHRDDPLSQEYLQEMLDGSKRAAELTRSLLAYSRKLEIQVKQEDLGDIIDQNGKMLRRLIRENVKIKTELLGGPLPVLADRAQIEQILMNLATNAQDAMPEGGTLTIATHRLESLPEASPATSQPDISLPCALLTVADTGTGIGPEQVERIFDPFFTTKEVGHGTGLGLAQVYGTVQQHHGVITVASKPGEGTLFSILLPLHAEQAVVPAQVAEKKSRLPAPRPLSILLVEDEPQVRRVLKRLLDNQGHHIREADNGREATRLFQKCHQEIDLIIMDVIMPDMNGKEAYEEMVRLKPDLKILFISGYPGDIINVQDIREKKLALLAKPLDPAELMHKIKEITEGDG